MTTTFKQARALAKAAAAETWLDELDGTLYVSPTGWQDDEVWVVEVGARENLVGGDSSFARYDDHVTIVDKATGAVGELNAIRDFERIDAMRPARVASR